MGLGGINFWQLVIILIVFLLSMLAASLPHPHHDKTQDDSAPEAETDESGSRD